MNLRDRIRTAELERARPFFPSSASVLEIGGDRGHQAKLLSEWGLNVTSIDVAPAQRGDRFFPVQQYDGRHIPFASRTFDVVFSSNVLEHVQDVRALLQEAARVLKAGGLMIHILPSVTWRWWTILVRYLWIIRSVVFRLNDPEIPTPKPATPYTPAHLLRFVWSITFPHAHGVYSNAIRKRLAKLLGSSCSIYVVCEP